MATVHVLTVPGADPARDAVVAQLVREADACVHADPQRRGLMPNWLDALACAASDAARSRWSVIVQDDARPLPGWQSHLGMACYHSPRPLLCLTHFGDVTRGAAARGVPYIVGEHWVWGGANAYHRDVLGGLHEWASMIWEQTGYCHDDRMISAYAARIGSSPALSTVALFDQGVGTSTLGHPTSGSRPGTPLGRLPLTWWRGRTGKPRFETRPNGTARDQREWLARYGTQDPTPWHFVPHGRAAVRRVDPEPTTSAHAHAHAHAQPHPEAAS
jgi:hypothetical protein